jgi:hypothetical protein
MHDWEKRLREMVFAGGALAMAACADHASTAVDAGHSFGPDGDGDGSQMPQDAGPSHSADACCNANPDPCCSSHYCGATVTVQCTEKMACEADGGTWNFAGGCALDAGTRDGTSDAP